MTPQENFDALKWEIRRARDTYGTMFERPVTMEMLYPFFESLVNTIEEQKEQIDFLFRKVEHLENK